MTNQNRSSPVEAASEGLRAQMSPFSATLKLPGLSLCCCSSLDLQGQL